MKVLHKMMQYVLQRKLLWVDGVMFLLLLLGGFVYQRGNALYDLLPRPEVVLINPYLVQSDGQDGVYVIDNERSRVVMINSEKEVEYLLKSNELEEDSFSYAEDLEFDPEGNVYLLDAGWNETGSAVAREAILVYDAEGRYIDTLMEIRYDDEYVDKHRLFALTYRDQALYYVESGQKGCYVCRLSLQTKEVERIAFYGYQNAFNLIQDYTLDQKGTTVYALDKRGKVLKGNNGVLSVLYDTGADPAYAGETVLYRLVAGENGSVYLTDIKQNKLYCYTEGEESLKVFADQGQVLSITSAFTPDGSLVLGLLLNSEICMIHMDPSMQKEGSSAIVIPKISGNSFLKTASYRRKEIIFQFFVVTALLGFLWCLSRGLILLSGIKISAVRKTGLLAAGTAAVVAMVIVTQLFNQFTAIYREELINKLFVLAHTISGMVDGDSLGRIRAAEDYMNADYMALMDTLTMGLNREDASVREMYCNVLCYEDGKGFAIAYLDNSIGTYYPREEEETMELARIYETKEEVQNEVDDDTGSYIYVCVPVLDKQGAVAGVIEVGTTTHVLSQNINSMRQSVLVTLILVILIILFMFGEVLSFFEQKARYRKKADRLRDTGTSEIPLHLLRLSIFVTYMAFNVASSFMPVYVSRFVAEDQGLSREIASSLPLTLNLIFIGLTSVCCAPLLRRFSFRCVAVAGAGISMLGDATLFLGQNYILLLWGLILNGIGVGVITNSMNMFIASATKEEIREEGFSLFNAGSLSGTACGMMLGASLAGIVGQRKVFCCSAVGWALIMVLLWVLGRHMGGRLGKERVQRKKVGAFLSSRGVMPYILLIQFPYVIINSFVYYYVPIYGDAQGLNESIICLLLMLNSLCSVYLSVSVTKYMAGKFGKGSIYLSSGFAFMALLLFGVRSTVPMLLAVLLLLGFAGSFGISVRQMYFTKLGGVAAYGEESAMGVYNLMDNVGGSAGPILFSAIMGGTKALPRLAAFVGVSGMLNGIYALIFRDKRK
ncbi:MAG: MFS transporter [Lachnospiraceae bacterium]|nr:MFS transporter [Lachnospiraceae bacterium]